MAGLAILDSRLCLGVVESCATGERADISYMTDQSWLGRYVGEGPYKRPAVRLEGFPRDGKWFIIAEHTPVT